MSIWKLVRLNFGRSPTHFGEIGIGLEQTSERVRSDTLFSAWVSSYARIFGSSGIEQLLTDFTENPEKPPFRVSSTFIYRRDGEGFIDYLPKPIEKPVGYPDPDLPIAKTYRKLNYLPLSIWRQWYQGNGFDAGCDLQQLINDYKAAFKPYELPKVSIDRTTRATNFYHTGLVQFAWEPVTAASQGTVNSLAGLYFLVQLPEQNDELEARLRIALELLGEEGLGGERSSGAGRFQVMGWDDLPGEWQETINFADGKHHALISLFWQHPLPPDYIEGSARYVLQERGGWIASPSGRQLRRKKVHMFAEGSVFPKAPVGCLANVTPEQFTAHRIYRSGVALSLPIKLAVS